MISGKLLKRSTKAGGVLALSVRADVGMPWFEVIAVPASEGAKIDQMQRVYEHPLVREIFCEIMLYE